MGKLYLMTTIVDRKTARKYQELYPVHFIET